MGESFSSLTALSGSTVADSDYLLIQDASAASGAKSKRILMSEVWTWVLTKLNAEDTISLSSIPSSDPSVAGQIYHSSGTLMVSL